MKIENCFRKLNVFMKFIRLMFMICLLANFVVSNTNTAKVAKNVRRIRPAKLDDTFVIVTHESINATVQLVRFNVSREIADGGIEVVERAPEPPSYANSDLLKVVNKIRRKKQATEGGEKDSEKREDGVEQPTEPSVKDKPADSRKGSEKSEDSVEQPTEPSVKDKPADSRKGSEKSDNSLEPPTEPSVKDKQADSRKGSEKGEDNVEQPTEPPVKDKPADSRKGSEKSDNSVEQPTEPSVNEKQADSRKGSEEREDNVEQPTEPSVKDKQADSRKGSEKSDNSVEQPTEPSVNEKQADSRKGSEEREDNGEQPTEPSVKDKQADSRKDSEKRKDNVEQPTEPSVKDKPADSRKGSEEREDNVEQPTEPSVKDKQADSRKDSEEREDNVEQPTEPSVNEKQVPPIIGNTTPVPTQNAEQIRRPPKNTNQTRPQTKSTFRTGATQMCRDGLIIRAWRPQKDVSEVELILRGFIYFLAMCYLFIGIYIATNRFMEAIEVITSCEREVTVVSKGGKREKITVRVWNDTVANLTLMALGSSAPEIILAVVEMFQKNFNAGDLGPGTILGSAAFNLFIIIAVCIVAIPKDEVRRIEIYRVFIVTAIWSLFAYAWLCLITRLITPEVIDLWEGLMTLVFSPLMVYHAYITDRRLFCPSFYQTSTKKDKYPRGESVNADEERRSVPLRSSIRQSIDGPEWRDFEQSRRDYMIKLKELHRKYPHYSLEKIEAMAQRKLIRQSNKSIAFYRIQSSRRATGGPHLMIKSRDFTADEIAEAKALLPTPDNEDADPNESGEDVITRIYFAPSHYTVMENAGHVTLHVWRRGNLNAPAKVEYYTEDGTAVAGEDYVAAQGVLLFEPGVEEQIIKLTIIDDEILEADEHFLVYLHNPSLGAVVVTPKVATVMIFDDDHCGVFSFIEKVYYIPEMTEVYEVKVVRSKGSRGKVLVPYFTSERSAINGKDFEDASGYLEFEKGVVEKTIKIKIIQEHSLEKDVVFEIYIGQPMLAEDDPLQSQIKAILRKPVEQRDESEKLLLSARPTKAKLSMTTCHIIESAEFRQTVNKLVQTANGSKLIGASSWKQQFRESLYVSGSWAEESDQDEDLEDDEGINERAADKEQEPSTWEYVAHFLTIFWKICFAIIPPAKIYNGYPCFIVSLFVVGLLTALLGDIATHFGCTLGVHDSVTAICFVSFGTSLPDTFVSRIAAKHDSTADNAIGNVTGSNSVNVFLGIGLAWTVAVIYHTWNGEKFQVPPGPILFSTVLFIGEACIAFLLLAWRRHSVGGELGGPDGSRVFHCILFISLWIIYVTISSLEAYDIISGF